MTKKSRTPDRTERAAEITAAQQQRERVRRVWAVVGVVAAMILIVGGSVAVSILSQDDVEASPAGAGEYGLVYGTADAPHTVVIYEDFLCSHCASLEQAAGDDLATLADEGRVLIDYRPIAILGQDSVRTLNAFKAVLEQAGPVVAREFHDSLYASHAEAPWSDDDLVDLAAAAGADVEMVREPIADLTHASWVREATDAAQAANVTGTPTVVLDGEQFTDGGSAAEIGENLVAALRE